MESVLCWKFLEFNRQERDERSYNKQGKSIAPHFLPGLFIALSSSSLWLVPSLPPATF